MGTSTRWGRAARPGARRTRTLLAVVAAVALASVACAGSASDGATAGEALALPDQDQPFSAQAGDDASALGARVEADLASVLQPGRAVISTANLVVETDDVATAAQRARVAVEGVGGVLFAESSTFRDDVRSVLTLKVPPAEFQSMLATLRDLGDPVEQDVHTEDVTERAIDLESRIKTADASIARLRALMDGVGSLDDIARLEGELLVRETDLENLEAQRRALGDQVDLATIVLTLAEPSSADDPDDGSAAPGFTDGLRGSWEALQATANVALVFLAVLLPWVPVAAVGWAVGLWVRHRSRRRDPAPA